MALDPGTRLGPYEIAALIGIGGMGEVYRARDTNLGRDVAIKALPDTFAQDPERLARFEREEGLTSARVHLLWVLGTTGPSTQQALAHALEVTPRNVTGLVDGLVASGHVTREPHEGDRRRTQVTVTASGREEVLLRLMPMFLALQRLDASFDADERAVVERYLRGALEAFRAITGPPAQRSS